MTGVRRPYTNPCNPRNHLASSSLKGRETVLLAVTGAVSVVGGARELVGGAVGVATTGTVGVAGAGVAIAPRVVMREGVGTAGVVGVRVIGAESGTWSGTEVVVLGGVGGTEAGANVERDCIGTRGVGIAIGAMEALLGTARGTEIGAP